MENSLSFEKNILVLKQIVEELETGNLNLEKLVQNYEKGMNLINECNGILNIVEEKIESFETK
ncbi:exodeoxyribonuclease VII small subunit [bacterium]|nr:exodeoxyribonuclease VII small subunit [bacterium]